MPRKSLKNFVQVFGEELDDPSSPDFSVAELISSRKELESEKPFGMCANGNGWLLMSLDLHEWQEILYIFCKFKTASTWKKHLLHFLLNCPAGCFTLVREYDLSLYDKTKADGACSIRALTQLLMPLKEYSEIGSWEGPFEDLDLDVEEDLLIFRQVVSHFRVVVSKGNLPDKALCLDRLDKILEWSLIRRSPFPYKDWLELDWLTTFLRDCGDLAECVFFEDITSDAEDCCKNDTFRILQDPIRGYVCSI